MEPTTIAIFRARSRISLIPCDQMNSRSEVTAENWAARRVMVTGANGFVGRWLVEALVAKGATVTAVVRQGSAPTGTDASIRSAAVAVGNVADADFIGRTIRNSSIDTVFHLAAVNVNRGCAIDPRTFFDAHFNGAYAVLEAARLACGAIRVVLASSCEVEDCLLPKPARRVHPYMASKASAELMARAYHDTFEIPVVVLRSQNIYGGGDTNWDRLIPGTVRSLLQGEQPVIRGTGRRERDFVHVDDAVAAYLKAAELATCPRVRGQVFRIATGRATKVLEVVRMLARFSGREDVQPVVLGGLNDDRVDAVYSLAEERQILGWSSSVSLQDGLARTVAWYASHFCKPTDPLGGSATS